MATVVVYKPAGPSKGVRHFTISQSVIEFQAVMNQRPLPRFVMLSDDLAVLGTRIVEAYTEEEK